MWMAHNEILEGRKNMVTNTIFRSQLRDLRTIPCSLSSFFRDTKFHFTLSFFHFYNFSCYRNNPFNLKDLLSQIIIYVHLVLLVLC